MTLYNNIEHTLISNLQQGQVLLHATDTIYGVCASMDSVNGHAKLYKIKQRDTEKPIILLVNSMMMLKTYVKALHPRIETLLEIHKRPLTIIYPNPKNLPEYLLAQDGSIAIRIVRDIQTKEIITRLGHALCSSSANIEGEQFPTTDEEISQEIINAVDMKLIPSKEQFKIMTGEPSVLASYHKKSGDLHFLRK